MGNETEASPPPLVNLPAAVDNSVDKLCDARFSLYPIVSDMAGCWGRLPQKLEPIQPEFGAKLRGMLTRVPRDTWDSAHDRRRATELKHWSSLNYHAFKQDEVFRQKFLVYFIFISYLAF